MQRFTGILPVKGSIVTLSVEESFSCSLFLGFLVSMVVFVIVCGYQVICFIRPSLFRSESNWYSKRFVECILLLVGNSVIFVKCIAPNLYNFFSSFSKWLNPDMCSIISLSSYTSFVCVYAITWHSIVMCVYILILLAKEGKISWCIYVKNRIQVFLGLNLITSWLFPLDIQIVTSIVFMIVFEIVTLLIVELPHN